MVRQASSLRQAAYLCKAPPLPHVPDLCVFCKPQGGTSIYTDSPGGHGMSSFVDRMHVEDEYNPEADISWNGMGSYSKAGSNVACLKK